MTDKPKKWHLDPKMLKQMADEHLDEQIQGLAKKSDDILDAIDQLARLHGRAKRKETKRDEIR